MIVSNGLYREIITLLITAVIAVELIVYLKIAANVVTLKNTLRDALALIRSSDLSDIEKEKKITRYAWYSLGKSGWLLLSLIIILLIAGSAGLIAGLFFFKSLNDTIKILTEPSSQLILIVASVAYSLLRKKTFSKNSN